MSELQRFADEFEEDLEGKDSKDAHCVSVGWARRCIAAMRAAEKQQPDAHPEFAELRQRAEANLKAGLDALLAEVDRLRAVHNQT